MDWNKYASLYSSATGIEMSADDMKAAADRIWNIFKAINVREGFSRKDDRFPKPWLEPLLDSDGEPIPVTTCEGRDVSVETFNKMLDEYSDISRKVAKETGSQMLDLREAFMAYLKEHNPDNAAKGILTRDTVHLSKTGNIVLTDLVLDALNVPSID